jgi:entericidin B
MMNAVRALTLLLVVSFTVGLSACNTIRGAGQDIEAGGKAIQRSTR